MKLIEEPDALRSALMRRVRRAGTEPELVVGSLLRKLGQSYRLNVKALPGSPDFANRRRKWAVFVQGCFWHHHTGCRRATFPKKNADFWAEKFKANRRRDARAILGLRRMGFRVLLIWECQLRDPTELESHLRVFARARRVSPPDPH